MPTFAAVLLAGGASRRMGRDKALLEVPNSGQLLWQRQWQVLEALEPVELFWSGPARPRMPENAKVMADRVANAGPLAGLSACLHDSSSDLLIVLAVDLPRMTAPFLRGLMSRCTNTSGAVIQHGDFFEPLAAIYPKRLQSLAADHLAQGRYALQDFIRKAIKFDAMTVVPCNEEDAPLFKNVNAVSDIEAA